MAALARCRPTAGLNGSGYDHWWWQVVARARCRAEWQVIVATVGDKCLFLLAEELLASGGDNGCPSLAVGLSGRGRDKVMLASGCPRSLQG